MMMIMMLWSRADLFLLHIEVVDDDADEKVEREEWSENDEKHEVEIHEDTSFWNRLQTGLQRRHQHWLWVCGVQNATKDHTISMDDQGRRNGATC